MEDRPNYITPAGYRRLREEYEQLFADERPRLVEVISWAAGNGDRSENGDYIYGRKRLREIDRRINWLSRRMASAKVTDPAQQVDRTRAWFGATLVLLDDDENERILTLVGDDEADAAAGRVSWNSPFGRAFRGATVGDVRSVTLPSGDKAYEVAAITYPEPES
jgi:transcription elongation factor GreB